MKAMLIDTNWCFGCHACEIACQMELGVSPDQGGLRVSQVGSWSYTDANGEEKWQHDFIVTPTDQCKGCFEKGEQPPCARICQSQCIEFGELDELKQKVTSSKQLLYVLNC